MKHTDKQRWEDFRKLTAPVWKQFHIRNASDLGFSFRPAGSEVDIVIDRPERIDVRLKAKEPLMMDLSIIIAFVRGTWKVEVRKWP